MKKYICIMVLFFAAAMIVGCAAMERATEISEHSEYTAKGDSGDVYFGEISDLSFISGENPLPHEFPVYVNRYPSGQTGILYEVDQPTVDLITVNLEQFIGILFNEEDVSGYAIGRDMDRPERAFYMTGETEIISEPSGFVIWSKDYGFIDSVINGSILESKLVQAALSYMNIENPKITSTVKCKIDGSVSEYEYLLTETVDDFFEDVMNKSFSRVRVYHYLESETVILKIGNRDISEIFSHEPVLPYEDAVDYIKTNYGVDDESGINAEIYYSSTVEEGYYVPCYKFYVSDSSRDTASGRMEYEIVSIPMPKRLHIQ
ncbi:MAG: hypothetical protein FWG42_06485 [Clostridiales bacterium]|nr:hypothetical protein [Clostridiales bacterium]